MLRITVSSIFATFIYTSAHAAWVPVDCKDRSLEVQSLHKMSAADLGKVRQNYRAAVLKAKPRSPLYTPHPYPKNREEILSNFRYAYFDRLFAGKSLESLPEGERPIYKALKEEKLRVGILRVENWGFSRCTGEDPSPFYYLLRLFDPTTGKEVARSKQFGTGHMGIYRHVSEPSRHSRTLQRSRPLCGHTSRFRFLSSSRNTSWRRACLIAGRTGPASLSNRQASSICWMVASCSTRSLLEPREPQFWRAGSNRSGKVSSLWASER
jgi:hypothetical protein